MSLFRRDLSSEYEYAREGTPDIVFLDRSPRTDVEVVRTTLDEWFTRYPDSERGRFRKAFRDKRNHVHLGAFLELYCHELLTRAGIHPIPHHREPSGRPKDFRCDSPAGTFDLEATVCADTETKNAQKSNRGTVTDYINEHAFVRGVRYMASIRQEGESLPPLRSLAEDIRTWASGFDRRQFREHLEASGIDALPTNVFEANDWEIELTLIPRPDDEENYQKFRHAIGIGPFNSGFYANDKSLRNSLKAKASHYSDNSVPYVIAVNAWFEFAPSDDIDLLQALFGTETLVIGLESHQPRMTRKPDGLWRGPHGPRNRHVSSVLYLQGLRPWSIAKVRAVLYVNPFADRPIDPSVIPVDLEGWDRSTGERSSLRGPDPWETFGLHPDWPHTSGASG